MSYGCSMTQPWRAQYRDSVKISSWKVTGVFMRDGLLVWPGLYPAPSPGTPRASDGMGPDRAVFHRWQLVALLCRWWLVTTFRRRFIPVVRWRLGSVIRRWQEQIEGTLAHRLGGITRIAFEQGQKFFRALLEIARAGGGIVLHRTRERGHEFRRLRRRQLIGGAGAETEVAFVQVVFHRLLERDEIEAAVFVERAVLDQDHGAQQGLGETGERHRLPAQPWPVLVLGQLCFVLAHEGRL